MERTFWGKIDTQFTRNIFCVEKHTNFERNALTHTCMKLQ